MTGLTIKSRLWLGFGLLVLLLVIITVVGLMRLSALQQHMNDIVHDTYVKTTLTNNIINQVHHTSRALRNILLIDDERQNKEDAATIIKADSLIQDNLDQLRAMTKDATSQDLLNTIMSSRDDYLAQRKRVVNLLDVRFKDGVIGVLIDDVSPVQQRYIGAIEQLAAHQADVMRQTEEHTAATYLTSCLLLIVLPCIGLLIAAFVIHQFVRAITSPLHRAAQILHAVAQGDLSSPIHNINQHDASLLFIALRQMHEGLTNITLQIRQSVSALATAAKQQGTRPTHSPGNPAKARDQDQEATHAAVQKMAAVVKQTSELAQQANSLATSAADIASQGGKAVGEVVDTMQSISDASKKIADIVNVIDSIAIQTNLLALNAAVEAARAGEQGRGFAVVASEVRNLAQRSATAAKEIKALIEDTVAKVDTGSQSVVQAGTTMTNVVDSIERVAHIVGEMRAAYQDQDTDSAVLDRTLGQLQHDDNIQAGAAAEQMKQGQEETQKQTQEQEQEDMLLQPHIARLVEAVSRLKIMQHRPAPAASGQVGHRPVSDDTQEHEA